MDLPVSTATEDKNVRIISWSEVLFSDMHHALFQLFSVVPGETCYPDSMVRTHSSGRWQNLFWWRDTVEYFGDLQQNIFHRTG